MFHRFSNHPGVAARAFAGVGVAALLIDIAALAAAQAFASAALGGNLC